MFQRSVTHIHHPLPHRGFMGPDHAARLLIDVDYKESDPFIMLADDRLVKTTNEPVGGPHPHAGFETVSLLLKGDMGDDRHRLKAGDLQLMTAGSGVIHTETIESAVDFHLLQLWLVLPKKERWAKPRVQDLAFEDVPLLKTTDYSMRLYSGAMAGLQSPITNYTPFIIADFELKGGATTIQNIPANYTAFLYVLDGKVIAGQEDHMVDLNRVAWFDKNRSSEASEIKFTAGSADARFVLYAGLPQGDPILSHGPFIADTPDDISRLYKEYRSGKMRHISTYSI